MSKPNIDWVTDTLATGGDLPMILRDARAQMRDIVASGIEVVIDLRAEADDRDLWEKYEPDVTYVHIPAWDLADESIPHEVFDIVVATARIFPRVLVHCHMGINRGPSGAFAVLLDQGHDPIDAFKMIREARPEAAIYFAMDALKAHHRRLGLDTHSATKQRADFQKFLNTVFTPEDHARIAHVIKKKHGFNLKKLF